MRYLSKFIENDLTKKMVLLSGPRQSGKTTLAKNLLNNSGTYLNWDISKDRQIIKDISWPKNSSLVILDELHKAPKWKNYLKGLADEFKNKPHLLVTGSARLDTMRKAGDALTGRFYNYHLHPVDVQESKIFYPKKNLNDRVHLLLETGGFPEAYLNPKDSERLRNDRFELVVREDLLDITKVTAYRSITNLIDLLRERIGKPLNYDSLGQDLSVSGPTVKSWIELLERLYIIFLIKPYSNNFARSIRKEQRVYFYDCGSSYNESDGSRLENLVACSLLKQIQLQRDTTGKNWELHYLRDKDKHEVDFAISLNRKIQYLIEVKTSETKVSTGFYYYTNKLNTNNNIQLVHNLDRPLEKNGVKIISLASWLDSFTLTQKF